ncbi:uncharacterized protein N0V89_007218 [Didymosphaeria variabile]|uniref:Uncharacterized protein n=1 Tax=Didymosphaeria variabile TaxID=1932322 RepID=A0A9W8XIR3_9PLEO|nr:uncharacterized protein N0V89_007218 [Didymosphaeria variabile]KAJ4351874.1 hypothetical protein N0V89_007218 [Didymosphaeria variabile]
MAQKTYFALPNLDHPPYHFITLGQIITLPSQPWARLAPPLPISQTLIATTVKTDWGTELRRNREHRIGIWAQFAAMILGVGADAVVAFSKKESEAFQFDELETSFFEPDDEYVERSVVGKEEVAEWVKRNPRQSVFMVTGIKIAKGAMHLRAQSKDVDVELKPGVDATPFSGVPVSGGVLAGVGKGKGEKIWFGGSDEFVFAYRLRRIVVKRQTVSKTSEYVKGATVAHDEREASSSSAAHEMPTASSADTVGDVQIESVEKSQMDYGSGGYPVDGFDATMVRDEQDDEECLLQVHDNFLDE